MGVVSTFVFRGEVTFFLLFRYKSASERSLKVKRGVFFG